MEGLKAKKIYQPLSLTFVVFYVLVIELTIRDHLLLAILHFSLTSIKNIFPAVAYSPHLHFNGYTLLHPIDRS